MVSVESRSSSIHPLLNSPSLTSLLRSTLYFTNCPAPVPAYALLDSVYFTHSCLFIDFLKDLHFLCQDFAFIFSSKVESHHLPNDFSVFQFISK